MNVLDCLAEELSCLKNIGELSSFCFQVVILPAVYKINDKQSVSLKYLLNIF